MKYIVRSAGLKGFPELVSSLGQSPTALLDAEGIEPAALQTPDLYIPYPALARLINRAAKVCARPDFGALLALHQGLDITGALCTHLCLQANMGQAMSLINSDIGFHARGIQISSQQVGDEIRIHMGFDFQQRLDCTQLTSLSLGVLVRSLAELRGGTLLPLRVELQQSQPYITDGLDRLFSHRVCYNAESSCAVYPSTLIDMPVSVAPSLAARLDDAWRTDNATQTPLSLATQTERIIIALLPSGDCSLDSVAQLLELHPRVLQKRLQREDCSYGSVLRQAREKLACQHLASSDVNLTTLAMNLGFGDLSVFSRNFKRWTGLSPSQWRAASADH